MPRNMTVVMRTAMILLVGALALTGCGSGDGATSDPTATVVATPTAVATTVAPPEITLGEVVWTSAIADGTGAPVDALTSLPNNASQVVAAVPVETLPAGVTIQASWSIDGDALPGLEPAPILVDEAREDAWLAWTLSWSSEQPWPIGRLGIHIQVDGETRLSDEIIIVRARE